MSRDGEEQRVQPYINVTPLIDVLLVLLIIFMVVTPLKPSRFEALVPDERRDEPVPVKPNPLALIVEIRTDGSLKLNGLEDMGSINETGKLSAALVKAFEERRANHTYAAELATRTDLPEALRVQRTVFIKAPRAIRYGEVAKVIDGIKGAGAYPIGLQIDDLN
ncbi:MAG: biopolymer transporter ExbD [Acidobacteria bacterium]|nr:biopolymer transporter ExbD [Acidobacteriota bacterium]